MGTWMVSGGPQSCNRTCCLCVTTAECNCRAAIWQRRPWRTRTVGVPARCRLGYPDPLQCLPDDLCFSSHMRLMKLPALLASIVVLVVEAAPVTHPLDPLTPDEIRTVTAVLSEAEHADEESRYVLINLHEPPKQDVLQWRPGVNITRSAFVVLMNGPRTFEAIVDLHQSRVESWKEIKDVQPTIVADEWEQTQKIVRSSPQWKDAIRKRGIPDPDKVVCIPLSAGYFGDPRGASPDF